VFASVAIYGHVLLAQAVTMPDKDA
jgi:hypothetical protein